MWAISLASRATGTLHHWVWLQLRSSDPFSLHKSDFELLKPSTVSMGTCPLSACSTLRTTHWPSSLSRAWTPSVLWRSPARSCCCASVPSGCTWTHRAAGRGSRSSCGRLCPTLPVSARCYSLIHRCVNATRVCGAVTGCCLYLCSFM